MYPMPSFLYFFIIQIQKNFFWLHQDTKQFSQGIMATAFTSTALAIVSFFIKIVSNVLFYKNKGSWLF
jgi:hypothetical protein